MVAMGLLLSDVPASVSPAQQFRDVVRITHEAQDSGFTYIVIGQHFLYGDLRWLQPVPLLARLAAEVNSDVRLATQIMIAPLYHPVMLAEELATLDVVTEGRLVAGLGLGYRAEEFGYHGKYFTLENVRPHLKPVQEHLPIWVGAHSLPGAIRAGKYGDGYACPPETPVPEIRERFSVVAEGFAERGKPFTAQPLRRNIMVADTKDEALLEFARVAQGRYLTYLEKGLDVMANADLKNEFAKAVEDHAVVGTPDQVTEQLVKLVTDLPVDPLLVRPQWPTMNVDETVAAIRRIGREIVPTITAITPRNTI